MYHGVCIVFLRVLITLIFENLHNKHEEALTFLLYARGNGWKLNTYINYFPMFYIYQMGL